jgi:iron complex outermembrane recepter protein
MNKERSLSWLFSGVLPLLMLVLPAGAETVVQPEPEQEEGTSLVLSPGSLEALQATNDRSLMTNDPEQLPTAPIPQLSDLDRPATTVDEWMQQMAQSVVQVTGVQVNPTDTGVEVVLETADGQLASPVTSVVGNALIADIPNAVLALPDREEFQAASPAEGIALVSVTPRGDGIRVAITGNDAPPAAEVRTETQGLVLSVTPGTEIIGTEDDAIQVVVTATRTEEPLNRIPRSVTVIDRDDLDTQTSLPQSFRELLGREVPGFNPPSPQGDDRGLLRGRDVSYLIDGVPVGSGFARSQRQIGLDAIEQVEVVRGPNAVFGAQATGGTVNIIPRRPEEGESSVFAEIGTTAAVGGGDSFLIGEGFGYFSKFGFSGNVNLVDYLFSLSYEREGSLFDAEGDRIFFERPRDEDRTINLLGQLGFEFNEEQRLQLTVNHYDIERVNNEFIADIEGSDEAGKAQGIRIGQQEFIDTPPFFDRNTIVSLRYSHDNLLGSSVSAQGYYGNYSGNTGGIIDFRGGTLIDAINNLVILDIERLGGRLQIETPLWQQASLLWGADYEYQETNGFVDVIDPVAFDESSGRVIRRIDRLNGQRYNVADLGLFAQLQWDIIDDLRLSGGLRYSNFNVDIPSYTNRFSAEVEGGSLNFDDVVFNVGAVYQVTDQINLFANFAQGFSLPDFDRVLFSASNGFSAESVSDVVQPVTVNSYELGMRGNWNTLQFSLAGFFSDSELGQTLIFGEVTELVRTPQREYGVEATLDWQPSEDWLLGTTLSWQEGEVDLEGTGDFVPQSTYLISPLKWTAYVENQTLPGWRNRLQLLAVGGRSRNFEGGGSDPRATDGYIVLDLISSINIGGGTLNIGVENIFNNQYLVPTGQLNAAFDGFATRAPASRGRTISATYRITF